MTEQVRSSGSKGPDNYDPREKGVPPATNELVQDYLSKKDKYRQTLEGNAEMLLYSILNPSEKRDSLVNEVVALHLEGESAASNEIYYDALFTHVYAEMLEHAAKKLRENVAYFITQQARFERDRREALERERQAKARLGGRLGRAS